MIVSENIDAAANAFVPILNKSVALLKKESASDAKKYMESSGTKLEGLVLAALNEVARGTEFEGSIRLASGLKFPDIVLAAGGIGVEVKSTTRNHWVTTGNSVLESTRIPNIGRIFLMFGKLACPIDFKVRLYEECLKEVMVTHYPRYQIDMDLPEGQTIFDKIGMSYDKLRVLKEPITPIVEYYSSKLRPGESLWWAGNSSAKEQSSPMTIREFSSLDANERADVIARSFVLFPQLFGAGQDKFHDVLVWLLRNGIICGNIRDFYTAGGRWKSVFATHDEGSVPQIFKRFYENRDRFLRFMENADTNELEYYWSSVLEEDCNRMQMWMSLVRKHMGNKNEFASLQRIVLIELKGLTEMGLSYRKTAICSLQNKKQSNKPCEIINSFIDDSLKFREYLPLYSLRAVCGPFAEGQPVAPEGWVKVEGKGVLDDTQFVVKTEGASMEGLIEEGAYVILRKIGGDLEGKVLLVQRFEAGDPENGGAYTIKKFTKKGSKVVLKARNPEVADIVLEDDAEYSTRYRAIAEFKGVIP